MNYKLPPLPPQSSKVFRTAIGPVEVLAHTTEQMQAYAIAAIEAQGVPDGWQLVPKEPTEQMLREGWDFAGTRGNAEAAYKTMLASAPPAPQAEKLVKCSYGDNGYACCEGGPCAGGYWCVVCGRHLPADEDGVIVHDDVPHPEDMTFDEEERPQ